MFVLDCLLHTIVAILDIAIISAKADESVWKFNGFVHPYKDTLDISILGEVLGQIFLVPGAREVLDKD